MRIGIDLDNTLIDYTALFSKLAREKQLTNTDFSDRTALRVHIRQKYGDKKWQQLQALAYGDRIYEARIFPFVKETLQELRNQGHTLFIISHKTRYSNLLGRLGTDLHKAARQFLIFFGLDIFFEKILFLPNKKKKCTAIADLHCDIFIDDLPEILTHSQFPKSCCPILFSNNPDFWTDMTFSSWQALPPLIEPKRFQGQLLSGGRNSKILHTGDFILKYYHTDNRNRCRNEWQALVWLKKQNFIQIPIPLGCSPRQNCTILSYIPGSPPKGNSQNINQMFTFIQQLYEKKTFAQHLPPAADAAFCKQEIAEQIQNRLDRLYQIPNLSDTQKALHAFCKQKLEPAFHLALNACPDFGVLDARLRMPSPSDFGLHNAIATPNGQLIFLDFEYFGLDDPTKLMADILLHPGMKLKKNLRQNFIYRLLEIIKKEDLTVEQRLRYVFPLWKIKWCCILCNEFLTEENKRRDFARNHIADTPNRLTIQLEKAQIMLTKSLAL